MTKYGAIPTTVDGYRFASRAEARRYAELRLMALAGELEPMPDASPPSIAAVP